MKLIPVVLVASLLTGCAFEEWGSDLGSGLASGVNKKADSLAYKIIGTAVDTLTRTGSREKLRALADELGNELVRDVAASRDTLLGVYTREWIARLRRDMLGEGTRREVGALRDELLGARTNVLVAALRNSLLGDSTRTQAGALRDSLLGPATRSAVQVLVDSAMSSFARRFRQNVVPELNTQLSFIQRNASELVLLVAALAIGIIAFVWWQKRRYRQLLALLACQIHEIPDQEAYDNLTRGVQKKAEETGYEPLLRKVLAEQGVLESESWRPRRA